jgi:SPP1 family predicted phage head-tail adaptor
VEAGLLDREVTLWRRSSVRDAATGEDQGAWTQFATVWAQVKAAAGGETYTAQQLVAETTKDFTIWYRDDVYDAGVEMRITFAGKTYDVVDVEEVGRREGLMLRAVARAEAGFQTPG